MSKRVLICWELGGGSGHLETPGEIARHLLDMGHRVVFATRNLGATRRFSATTHLELVQSPMMWPPVTHAPAISLADMLLKFGYDRTDELCAVLDAWMHLFKTQTPDLIIAEHSPAAIVSAHICGIPVAIQGNGFFVPPQRTPMPAFFSTDTVDEAQLARIEVEAVDAINQALARYGSAPLDCLATLFPATTSFLATYPECDHFGERKGVEYYGTPDQRQFGMDPLWPQGQGEKIFVYMHPDYPQFPVMLNQLSSMEHPVLVVAPGVDHQMVQRLRCPNLRVQDEHVNLDTLTNECRIIICHAAHGTIARVLRHGIAPILTPQFVEQTMLAHRLALAQLAFAAHPDPRRHDYRAMIDAAIHGERHHHNAALFAARNPIDNAAHRYQQMTLDILALAT